MKREALRTGLLVLALVTVTSCLRGQAFSDPPPTFRDGDLVGVWKAEYKGYGARGVVKGIETLTLRGDGTYQQVYDGGSGNVQTGPWNRWWVEHFSDGGVRLWLERGRFYPQEIDTGGSGAYFTRDDGTGHMLNLFGGRAVLIVQVRSDDPEEIRLVYPPVGDPDSPVVVTFQRVPANESTPTVGP